MKIPEIGSEEMEWMKLLTWLAFTWTSCSLCMKPLDPILAHWRHSAFICDNCDNVDKRFLVLE